MAIQSYTFNGKENYIDIVQTPKFTEKTKEILAAFDENLPTPFLDAPDLPKKVQTMDRTAEFLKEANNDSTRKIAFACLNTAYLVTAIAMTVFFGATLIALNPAFLSTASLILLFGSFAFFSVSIIISILNVMDAAERAQEMDQLRPEPQKPWYLAFQNPILAEIASCVGAGLIAPLLHALTIESRFATILKEQELDISTTLEKTKTTNETNLPAVYKYYKEQAPKLLQHIQQKIEELERKICTLQAQPSQSEEEEFGELAQQEVALLNQLEDYYTARNELEGVMRFYKRFRGYFEQSPETTQKFQSACINYIASLKLKTS